MRGKLKPLAEQVVVVSGSGGGLGLEIARLAVKAGAAVVLSGRDEVAVRAACEALGKAGGRAHPVVGDAGAPDGCDRVARAATARFDRIDSWIETSGDEAAQACAARALAHLVGGRDAPGALVVFGRRIGKAARAELRAAKGQVAATLIKLPSDWRHDSPPAVAAQAALHAVAKPLGEMALAAKGEGLTVVTHAKKHPGVVLGLGFLAVAGIAAWFGRGRIAQAAASARPRIARAVRPAVLGAVRRQPRLAAKLTIKHPRKALGMAKVLR